MINFKQYFRSHLKSNLRAIVCIIGVVLVMTVILAMNGQPTTRYNGYIGKDVEDYYSTLYIPVTVLCILAYVLPVMEFSFFKKRTNLDCAYSLPISRRAMGGVHYLVGLVILFGTFTLSYLANLALMISRGPGWFDYLPMIEHYFLCLVLGFSIYSLMTFVFNQANTKGDGIWFMLLYSFVFLLIFGALSRILSEKYIFYVSGLPWGIINEMTVSYRELVEINYAERADFWRTDNYVNGFIFWVALGVLCAVGFFLTFGTRRAEKTEEISNSYFGFRTLIPIYAVCAMLILDMNSFVIDLIIALFALVGYTVYRRGFHYKIWDIAFLIVFLACAIIKNSHI